MEYPLALHSVVVGSLVCCLTILAVAWLNVLVNRHSVRPVRARRADRDAWSESIVPGGFDAGQTPSGRPRPVWQSGPQAGHGLRGFAPEPFPSRKG
jgi:hypothetical protein